jgi:hypothetical protein
VQANAIQAYDKGATGKGITAAIIDGGFGQNTSMFAGRIHAASTDVAGSRGIIGGGNHGTSVASIIGAAKDNVGMHGIAFDATLMMIRADTPGSGGFFDDANTAKAIDHAVQNGARVINISFGQNGPWSAEVVAAIDRATAAGLIIVFAAGNGGGANPPESHWIATQTQARGQVIVVGGANEAGTDLTPSSNRAGVTANFFMAALGQNSPTYMGDGTLVNVNATSFTAPVVAGAVALLAQSFPNLTGQQIANLLLTTASDMGAAGTDSVYGRGLLNLTKAFAPQGAATLAGSSTPISLTSNGVLSAAMGDAAGDLKGAVFLDSYARAYQMDLSRTLSPAARDAPLQAALGGSHRLSSARLGPLAVSITSSRALHGQPDARLQQMELSPEQARTAKAIAATAVARLSAKTSVAFGFSEGGRALQQGLSEQQGNAFLVARDPVGGNGMQARPGSSLGLRHALGPLALSVTAEGGEVHEIYRTQHFGRSGYRTTALIADGQLGRVRFSLGGSILDEEATVLGGRFSSSFWTGGSTSWFTDGTASLRLGGGWGAYASYRYGRTSIPGSGALIAGGRLSSNAFAFDLTRAGAFTPGDKIGFRIMQPLRVRTGGMDVNLPVSYDYASREVGYQHRFFNLAPTGREIDYEISYGTQLLGGSIAANAFVRTDAGHIDWMKNDVGGALRFTLGF